MKCGNQTNSKKINVERSIRFFFPRLLKTELNKKGISVDTINKMWVYHSFNYLWMNYSVVNRYYGNNPSKGKETIQYVE